MRYGEMSLNGRVVLPRVSRTTNALERMRGLLGREALQIGEGMLLEHCHSIHTLGMSYALDILFLDRQLKTMKIVRELPPLRMAGCRGAHMTLELYSGSAAALGLDEGAAFRWQEHGA